MYPHFAKECIKYSVPTLGTRIRFPDSISIGMESICGLSGATGGSRIPRKGTCNGRDILQPGLLSNTRGLFVLCRGAGHFKRIVYSCQTLLRHGEGHLRRQARGIPKGHRKDPRNASRREDKISSYVTLRIF